MSTNQYFPFHMSMPDRSSLNLSFDERPMQGTFVEHSHNQFEFFLFLDGDAEMIIDGKTHPLRENELLVIPERLPHHLRLKSEHPYRRVIFHVSSAYMRAIGLFAMIEQFCTDEPRSYDLSGTPFLQGIPQYSKVAISATPTLQATLFTERLTALYCALVSAATSQSQTQADKLIERAVWHINTRLDQKLTIGGIAEQLYTSESYLCKMFRQKMGIPLMHYVNRQRVHLARELILDGVPLKEVYLRCGYDNYVTFFRVFKSETGTSPSKLARGE